MQSGAFMPAMRRSAPHLATLVVLFARHGRAGAEKQRPEEAAGSRQQEFVAGERRAIACYHADVAQLPRLPQRADGGVLPAAAFTVQAVGKLLQGEWLARIEWLSAKREAGRNARARADAAAYLERHF